MNGSSRRFSARASFAFRFGVTMTIALLGFDLLRRLSEYGLSRIVDLEGIDRTPVGVLLSLFVALALAPSIALLSSKRLTARLSKLTQSVAESVRRDDLSQPFEVSGSDEISQLASALNSLRERVESTTRSYALQDIRRREWIAQVSHDLRTPLMAQAACLDRADSILEKTPSTPRRNEVRRLLGVAKMDGDRVHTLADDLLEIVRLDAGDRLHLEPVPPGELVSQAAAELEQLAAQRGIRLEVNATSRLPVLRADGRRLMRAIMNLIRNAIQHAHSRVEVLVVLSGDSVRFEVRDDGRGLPKQLGFLDYLRRRGEVRLTELARRGDRADSAGLGLVVAQRVAEAHEGKIDAYNLSRGGAAFWVDIPVPAEVPLSEDSPAETAR